MNSIWKLCLFSLLCAPLVVPAAERTLVARTYNSGFTLAHDSYNGMGTDSDGKVYYVLSSESVNIGAQMFSFNPKTRLIKHLGDLTEACGEKGLRAIPQGKTHVNFVECEGRLYFATHVGVYSIVDGMETMGVPPTGMKPYPGGHLLSYDIASGQFEDHGLAPDGEGILSFGMDPRNKRLLGLTWPKGMFFRVNLLTRNLKNFGKVCGEGESGKGDSYRTICRSICVDPATGYAYFTTSEGTIHYYDTATDSIQKVEREDMVKDYFGLYDPSSPGHMGYNWRQTFWNGPEHALYGVHGNSGYLFRFEPAIQKFEVLERLTSEPSKRTGMFDQFSYGYLGFTLGPDGRNIHYLTGGPIFENGKRVAGKSTTSMGEAKGLENLHLVTYNIVKRTYADHGPIFYENGDRPLYVNSIVVAKNGNVYFLARITSDGKTRTDLVELPKTWKLD